jgi:hypothetical protein
MRQLQDAGTVPLSRNEPAKSFAQHKKYRRLMGHCIGVVAVALAAVLFITDMPCEGVADSYA